LKREGWMSGGRGLPEQETKGKCDQEKRSGGMGNGKRVKETA